MKWIASVLLGILLLCLVPQADAGEYCRPYYRTTYCAPTYYPSNYYTPACAEPAYCPPVVAAPVYLKAVPAFTNPDYYSSVSDFYRDKLLVDAVAGKTAEVLRGQQELTGLRQEVESLRRQVLLQQPVGAPAQAPPVYQAPAPTRETAPVREAAPSVMPRAASSLHAVPQGLQAIVQASCVQCHGAGAQGGLDLRDLSSVPVSVRLAAKAAVDDGYMPKGGKPLSDQAAMLFHQWATGRAGAPTVQK